MKKYSIIWIIMITSNLHTVLACEVCKQNQPEALKNITHGTGPEGTTDFIISWTAVIIVVVTLFLSIKYLVKPKENDQNHIKNIVVE